MRSRGAAPTPGAGILLHPNRDVKLMFLLFFPIPAIHIISFIFVAMMLTYRAGAYLRYAYRAKNVHRVHSPFVFDLYSKHLLNHAACAPLNSLEELRATLLKNASPIHTIPLGAPSKTIKTNTTSVSEILKGSVITIKWSRILFRLIQALQPNSILELGSSIGFSSVLLHKAAPYAKIHTIEGQAEVSAFAKTFIQQQNAKNVQLHAGVFEEVLPNVCAQHGPFDFVYLDGDHRSQALIHNIETLLPHLSSNACILIDDIHWSSDMEKAWRNLYTDSRFMLSIDLYRMGLLFCSNRRVKEHFTLWI